MKIVDSVREAVDIAIQGGQTSVTNESGTVTMLVSGCNEQIFIDPNCEHFFDSGVCLMCDKIENQTERAEYEK